MSSTAALTLATPPRDERDTPHIPIAAINPHIPVIAKSFTGLPTLGPTLETGQRRALLGWTHKKDTPDGLLMGRLWCWVGEGRGAFQVYDSPINRSPFPIGTGRGPNAFGCDINAIDCGVANFGMVRMFHPFWCPYDRVPKDMDAADKAMCRHRYRQLIARTENARRQRGGRAAERNRDRNRDRDVLEFEDSEEEIPMVVGRADRRRAARRRRREVVLREVRSVEVGRVRVTGKGDGTVRDPVEMVESEEELVVEGGERVEGVVGVGVYVGDAGGYRELRGEEVDEGTENDPFFVA